MNIGPMNFQLKTFTPLQQTVAELGVCPFCHTKTLTHKHTGGGCEWHQCGKCLKVLALEAKSP